MGDPTAHLEKMGRELKCPIWYIHSLFSLPMPKPLIIFFLLFKIFSAAKQTLFKFLILISVFCGYLKFGSHRLNYLAFYFAA